MSQETLENLLHEERRFPPSPDFAAQAVAKAELYDEAAADRLAFWDRQARALTWATPWAQTLDWSDAPFAKWFVGGTLNVAYNCVDRHVETGDRDPGGLHFGREARDNPTITYAGLPREGSPA